MSIYQFLGLGYSSLIMNRSSAMHSRIHKSKTVPVRRYRRFRFGQWEDVCKHFRSPPRY